MAGLIESPEHQQRLDAVAELRDHPDASKDPKSMPAIRNLTRSDIEAYITRP